MKNNKDIGPSLAEMLPLFTILRFGELVLQTCGEFDAVTRSIVHSFREVVVEITIEFDKCWDVFE